MQWQPCYTCCLKCTSGFRWAGVLSFREHLKNKPFSIHTDLLLLDKLMKDNQICQGTVYQKSVPFSAVVSQVLLQRRHLQMSFNVLIWECWQHTVEFKSIQYAFTWVCHKPFSLPFNLIMSLMFRSAVFVVNLFSVCVLLLLLLSNLHPTHWDQIKADMSNTTTLSCTPRAQHGGMEWHIQYAAPWQLNRPVI